MKRARVTRDPSTRQKAHLESRFFVTKSVINGRGVFSRASIPGGAPVLKCSGLIQHRDEVAPEARAMQVGPDTYLVEDTENPSVDDFLNHSCQPNLGFVNGSLVLFALYEIKPGEELVFDYSTAMNEQGWTIKCRCRTPNCRGKVKSFCDLTAWEQKRLRRIALAYLR